MKRLFLGTLILLVTCQNILCQTVIDLHFIGRLDGNVDFPLEGSAPSYNWVGSNIYSSFAGSFGKHFSLVAINHWATSITSKYPYGDTPWLYKNTFKSNLASWLNYLFCDFHFDRWSFRIGKDIAAIGGLEYTVWEWNYPYYLYSTFSGLYSGYQWGGSVSWWTASKKTALTLQATSSPFSYVDSTDYAIPWYRGTGNYFLKHRGKYSIVRTINSIGVIQKYKDGKRTNQMNFAFGVEVALLKRTLSIGCEYLNGFDINVANSTYQHLLLTTKYDSPSDKWSLFGKFGYENYYGSPDFFGGIMAAYYPLKGKKDLRIEGVLSAYSGFGDLPGITLTVGALYNLPLHFEPSKRKVFP